MHLAERATSDTTSSAITTKLTTTKPDDGKNLLQTVIDIVLQYLSIGLIWIWRTLRIEDILRFILLLFLTILKWYAIGMAVTFCTWIICRVGYWGLPKLWEISREIYRESQRRKLEEQWRKNEIKRQTKLLAERTANEAAIKEAMLRKAQEEQAIKDRLRREEEMRQIKSKEAFIRWERDCDIAFRNKGSMTKFPFPPLPRCTDINCVAFTESPAPACKHNVKQFLKSSGHFTMEFLKDEKNRWHEDRFTLCRDDLKPQFRRLANSLFVILNPLYEELKKQQEIS
ncbi:hypothetical protein V491_02697 [Pseudogymnoascus sp. VKM F-3775]|nr:hypothetical protein V491_02697 [Pseudogymnoascus sp. VKM F-3775]